jgi:cobalamin biosynthesis Co2+ chelatase CbiK
MSENNKNAILVVSYGSSNLNAGKLTLDRIENDIQSAYPAYSIYHAWTSKMIIHKILIRDGIQINSVSEAIKQMIRDGIQSLAVQPTLIIGGMEYESIRDIILDHITYFDKVTIGQPLLITEHDIIQIAETLMQIYSELPKDEALLFMGHGTDHKVNSVYSRLNSAFSQAGYRNVFIGTLKSYPTIDTIKTMIKSCGASKVTLAPFMLTASKHTLKDMAGANPSSWKSQLIQEGYKVHCICQGLGEYPEIRMKYIEKLKNLISDH